MSLISYYYDFILKYYDFILKYYDFILVILRLYSRNISTLFS